MKSLQQHPMLASKLTGQENWKSFRSSRCPFIVALFVLSLVASSWTGLSQGLVNFRYVKRVLLVDQLTPAKGTNYLAELIAAPVEPVGAPFLTVGDPVPFDSLGRIDGGIRSVVNVAPGSNAIVRLRVWDSEGGIVSGYTNARTRVVSEAITMQLAYPEGPHQNDFPIPNLIKIANLTLAYHAPTDPCDCELIELFRGYENIGSQSTHSIVALSGNGEAVLIKQSGYNQTFSGYQFNNNYSIRKNGDFVPTLVSWSRFNPFDPNQIGTSEPSWDLYGLTVDGKRSVGNHDKAPNRKAFLFDGDQKVEMTPFSEVFGVSGDGKYAIGMTPSGDWIRLEIEKTNSTPLTILRGQNFSSWSRLVGVSRTGAAAVWATTSSNNSVGLWVTGQEPRLLGLAGFQPTALSSDGLTIVGRFVTNQAKVAAYWTEAHGLKLVHGAEANSMITGVSGDGTIFAGFVAAGATNNLRVWRRTGSPLTIPEVVRGLDLQVLDRHSFDFLADTALLSDDGHRLAFSSSGSLYGTDRLGFLATISFPGELPALRIKKSDGKSEISWIGKVGYRYRVNRSEDLIQWTPWSGFLIGSNAPVHLMVTESLAPKVYFRLTTELAE